MPPGTRLAHRGARACTSQATHARRRGQACRGAALPLNPSLARTPAPSTISLKCRPRWAEIRISTSLSDNSGLFLTSATGLRFLPAANFNGVPGSLTVRLADSSITAPNNGSTVNVSGANNGAGTAYSASTVVLATSITAVNDAPV
ncbi:MAG: hypothetical protein ACK5S1_00245, partial [bacterium]